MYENVKTIETGGFSSAVLGFLKGAFVAVIYTLLVFLAAAFVLSYTPLPENAIPYIAYIVQSTGAAISGFLPAKKAGTRGIITGATSGGLYILIIWLIASLFADGITFGSHIITMLIISVISGATGGIFGVNLKNSNNNKKKR